MFPNTHDLSYSASTSRPSLFNCLLGIVEIPPSLKNTLDIWVQESLPGENRQEASHRIIHSFSYSSESLDLSGLSLSCLPEVFQQIAHLQEFNGSNNSLISLPPSFFSLVHLHTLNLSHNQFPTIPCLITQLDQLESINFSHNCLITIPETLWQLKFLTSLALEGNQLSVHFDLKLSNLITTLSEWKKSTAPEERRNLIVTQILQSFFQTPSYLCIPELSLPTFPPPILCLKQLSWLDLSGNNIESLPNTFCSLINLSILHLSNNKLGQFPEDIDQLGKLIFLDLSKNPLTYLPENISLLKSIECVHLNETHLKSVPISIGQLSSLKGLGLSQNNFTVIPDLFNGLQNLRHLFLGKNQLTQLPDSLFKLRALEHLDLSENKLSFLPKMIGDLTTLTTLLLFENALKKFPRTMGHLTSLESLQLARNNLRSVPSSLGKMLNLTFLDLSENQIRSLPNSMEGLIKLTTLCLDGNQLTSLPSSFENLINLQDLILHSNDFRSISRLDNLTQIKILDLSNNYLETLAFAFEKLICLEELNLSSNKLSTLPPSISFLHTLKSINLSDNCLAQIPDELLQLSNLTEIDLQNNLIQKLPEDMSSLCHLKILFLSNNRITRFPRSLFSLPSDLSIHIVDNLILLSDLEKIIGTTQVEDYMGPSIEAIRVLPEGVTQLELSFGDALIFWFKLSQEVIDFNFPSLEPMAQANIESLLNFAQGFADAKNSSTLPLLAKRICKFIRNISSHQEFQIRSLGLLDDAFSACHDKPDLIFSDIECIQKFIFEIPNATDIQYAHFRICMHRLDLLTQIAHKKIAERVEMMRDSQMSQEEIDVHLKEVKIHLFYRTELTQILNLPLDSSSMLYSKHSDLAAIDANMAAEEILDLTSSLQQQIDILSLDKMWRSRVDSRFSLDPDYTQEKAAIDRYFDSASEKITLDTSEKTSQELTDEWNCLRAEQKKAYDDFYKSKTSLILNGTPVV